MKKLVVFAAILFSGTFVFAQGLPRHLSPEEKLMIMTGNVPERIDISDAVTSSAAVSTPRSIAEWEELQAIAITWTRYQEILTEIVRHAVEEVDVIIITENKNITAFQLDQAGIDPDSNIIYITEDFNSVWIRDYGPNAAYTSDVDSLVLVDWIYNRPRPFDDVIPAAIAQELELPLLSTTEPPNDLVNTGGNYMANGLGRAFSSKLVLEENGPGNFWGESNHDEAAVDAIMAEFMGTEEYVKMETLPFDGIHHIDMHMKLLNENTILMGEYPEGVADGPQIEANLQYVLENFKQATGRDYNVVRIPMPPDQFGRYPDNNGFYRTYTNAVFINKTILVPTYALEYDTTALRIWEEAMPGHKIVGIDCNDIIPASGAIHCITKEIGVEEPLWVFHEAPLTAEATDVVDLSVLAKHRDGISKVSVFTSEDGITFNESEMVSMGDDTWSWEVAPLVDDTVDVYYYFEATAATGKVIRRPLVAPEGTFKLTFFGTSTSTAEVESDVPSINVFPNPASAITCVDITVQEPCDAHVSLVDMHGRVVRELHRGTLERGSNKVFFNAGEFQTGIYIIQTITESGSQSSKVIID